MISKETLARVNEHSNAILEVIDNAETFTRSDLQGVIEALVMNILNEQK